MNKKYLNQVHVYLATVLCFSTLLITTSCSNQSVKCGMNSSQSSQESETDQGKINLSPSIDSDGRTQLHIAALTGNAEVVKALLEDKDIEVNTEDIDGLTPLHLAASKGHVEVVKVLLEDKRVYVNAKDSCTPLHIAAHTGHIEVVKMLLEQPNILVNEKTDQGFTARQLAERKGHLDIIILIHNHIKNVK